MATTSFTNLITLTDASWFNDADKAAYAYLTGVAGTNTITATGPASLSAYAAGNKFHFVPAATNTGATTINITPSGASALGARNIFFNGAACVGGELVIGIPVILIDDGTRYNLVTNTRMASASVQATTSGTEKDFTGIPSWVKKITMMVTELSTNGTSIPIVQLGDAGGIETTGYTGSVNNFSGAGLAALSSGVSLATFHSATQVISGAIVFTLIDAATFKWAFYGNLGRSDTTGIYAVAGFKALTAALDRIRLTTTNGTDAFDAGAVNIIYE